MKSVRSNVVAMALAMAAGMAMAQPTLTSLGSGGPLSVTNSIGGTYYVGGSGISTTSAARWSLTGSTLTAAEIGGGGGGYMSADSLFQTGSFLNVGPSIRGNTAAGVAPPFNPNPTLVPSTTQPADAEFAARLWSSASGTWQSMGGLPIVPELLAYGSSSSGSSSGSFLTANAISATGRYSVGLGYVCTYNNAGTAVSASTFRWRPWIWDAQANGGAGEMIILPTPFRTTSNTSLRRTGNAYAVSADGLVVAGAQEHNAAVSPSADPDGARFVVWRRASLSDPFVMSFLDTGVDGNGFPKIGGSSTPSSLAMNSAGTIIAARGPDGITKWQWDGSTWGAPNVLGDNLTTPATWLPGSVTSCGVPPNIGGILAMAEDGNTIVGSAVYSTCGSFMTGGFIWTAADGLIEDWYDYNAALGTPGCSTGGFYGPIGDNGDPSRGLPVLGNPTAISGDGTAIVGFQGGTQRIVGAPPWIWNATGGPACVGPVITNNPSAAATFSACSTAIILNVASAGTAPVAYQWYKDGQPLFDGIQGSGSNVTGATSFQLRVNPPLTPADAGTYYAVVTGQCGSPAQSSNSVVSLDPAFPAATNDVCATAQVVTAGVNVLSPAQSPCGSYISDPNNFSACALTANPKTDLWYSFTPTASGDYRIETCGSNFDTLLSVFSGCNGSELACNDNLEIGPSSGCSSNRSRIASINLTENVTYMIRVAAPNTAFLSGTSTVNLSIIPAPARAANDDCSNASVAVVGTNAFDTTESTNDGFASCASVLSRDVWFTFSPSGRGSMRLATCPGTTWNTVLSMYDACGGNELACNDNAGISGCSNQSVIADYEVVGGQTFWIRIGGNSLTAFGAGQLTVEFNCIADFNRDGGVDGSDVQAFFTAWEAGLSAADANLDGGVDGSDVGAFFEVWEAGGCD